MSVTRGEGGTHGRNWRDIDFRPLLENLPAGAYLCDADGLITYYNRQAVELWGRAPSLHDPSDRFCGSFRLFTPDGEPIAHSECWMALALRERRRFHGREIVIERPNGERVNALAHANPIHDADGRLLGAVNMLMDVTERKQTEQQQRQLKAALVHAGRLNLAGEMAAGIAHELNQPLASVVNYSEACINLLRSGTAGSAELIANLELIATQAHHAGRVIHRLRDFTRRRAFRLKATNLRVVVREAMDLIAPELRENGVTLRVDVPATLPRVEVDPVQIQQVLINLARNGMESVCDAGDSGRREVVITAVPSLDAVTVSVRDTGLGIAPEIRDQLFHPFMTTREQGMGLGLSISRSIIEAHRGALWADAHTGPGATLHFTLPKAPRRSTGS